MRILSVVFCLLFIGQLSANEQLNNEAVNKVLDNFHQAAAAADFEQYFDLFADDGIYMGTDAGERWTKAQFKSYVKPYFSKGKGWLYVVKERHVSSTPTQDIVFFDELLENKYYGQCRGSGILIKTVDGWKILQYKLSVPVPNDISAPIVEKIKQFNQLKRAK
jgi:ketosteroid isomerase-like protein